MSAPDPHIRISNTQREALIGRLQAATEEGLLDLEEFAERSRQAYEAKTYADVTRLLADLPDDDRALAVPARAKGTANVPDLVLERKHSSTRRQGDWTVPARVVSRQVHSRVVLDCRRANFSSQDVLIEFDLTHSPLTVILPRNAYAVEGAVQQTGGRVANHCQDSTSGPRIEVTGRSNYGRVTIRYERRFLWWRW